MNKNKWVNRAIAGAVLGAIVASAPAWSGNLPSSQSTPTDPLLQALYNMVAQRVSAGGYGVVSGTIIEPCTSSCASNGYRVGLSGGSNTKGNSATAGIANEGQAIASGLIPAGGLGNTVLTTLNVQAVDNPTKGMYSAANGAGAMAVGWDTLSFNNVTAGEMATVSLTVTLSPNPGGAAEGYAGACLSVGTACNPITSTVLNHGGQSETLTATFALTSSPITIYDAMYAVADNSKTETVALLDPNLVITLPTGVTFYTASGNFGGTPVPLPAGWALFAGGAALLGAIGRRRAKNA